VAAVGMNPQATTVPPLPCGDGPSSTMLPG
jgi:hypothetical protein